MPDDARIRVYRLPDGYTIGQKRNVGSQLARGEIIATWDDDDYSAPERLRDQVSRLQQTGRAVTGYHNMQFTDGRNRWLFEQKADYALGTSLCYRKDWWEIHPFQPLRVGEDDAFVNTANEFGQLASVDAGELMVASIHPGNTVQRHQREEKWKKIS